MKKKCRIIRWGTVATLGLAIASLPISAADQSYGGKSHERSPSSDYSSTTDIHAGKMLGQVQRADKVIGKDVITSDNQKVGKLEDLIVDLDTGKILYAVVGSGGVLGAGEKKFAVAPRAFNEPQDDNIMLKVDKARLQGAPQFTSQISKDDQMGKASFVNQVHQYFAHGNLERAADRAANAVTGGTTEYKTVFKADDLSGMKIRNASNEELGKIDDIAVDLPNGHVVYVILSPDSSMKLGSEEYFALPPSTLIASADRKGLTTELTKDKLSAAPHFSKENWASLSNQTWASQVYQYYGKRAYFDVNSRLQPTGRTEDKSFPRTKD